MAIGQQVTESMVRLGRFVPGAYVEDLRPTVGQKRRLSAGRRSNAKRSPSVSS
jgi:hypothetical protein